MFPVRKAAALFQQDNVIFDFPHTVSTINSVQRTDYTEREQFQNRKIQHDIAKNKRKCMMRDA